MILTNNDKIMVVHRRLYENDHSRIFTGVVDGHNDSLIKVCGNSWVKNQYGGEYLKKEEKRTKILSLSSGTLIVYQLPNNTDLENLEIITCKEGVAYMTDHKDFKMDLSESFPQLVQTTRDQVK